MAIQKAMNSAAKTLLLISALVSLLFSFATVGQSQGNPERGFHPAGSYALSNLESVSTTSGNMMLNIPLAALPPGRGGMSAKLNLIYNSKLWDNLLNYAQDATQSECDERINPYCDPNNPSIVYVRQELLSGSNEGGWQYGYRYSLEIIIRPYDEPDQTNPVYQCYDTRKYYKFKTKIRMPDGGLHELIPQGYSGSDDGYYAVTPDGHIEGCPSNSSTSSDITYYSIDGSYLRLVVAHDSDSDFGNNIWTLSMPDGSRVVGGNGQEKIYDRNGNYVEIQEISNYNSTGHLASRIVDQLGRSIDIEYIPNSTGRQDLIHLLGVGDEAITWTVNWGYIQVNKAYQAAASNPNNMYPYLDTLWTWVFCVTSIDLPLQAGSGLSYDFDYDRHRSGTPEYDFGELHSITTPGGATGTYSYVLDDADTTNYRANDILINGPSTKTLTYDREYDGVSGDTASETTGYGWEGYVSVSVYSGGVAGPDGGATIDYYHKNAIDGTKLIFKTTHPDGSVVEKVWASNTAPAPWGYTTNPYVKTEYSSIANSSGTPTKTAIKDYTYDSNGNVTEIAEYDWVAYSSLTRDGTGQPSGIPSGATLKRKTVNIYNSAASSYTSSNFYGKSTSPYLRNAVASTQVQDGSATVLSRTELTYDSATTTGNVTQTKAWDSTKGSVSNPLTSSNSISTLTTYNSYGSPTLATDAKGVETKLTYGSVGGYTDLYPTRKEDSYNHTGVKRTSDFTYDFYTGVVTSTTDVDNNVATNTTYDVFGRPILVIAAIGKSEQTCVATNYSDLDRRVIVRKDLSAAGDGKLVSIQHYDRLGRVRLSRQLESTTALTGGNSICTNPAFNVSTDSANSETVGIKVQTRYFAGDSTHPNAQILVSNPYRAAISAEAGDDTTMGWARSKLDQSGRVVELQSFSGTSLPAPWGSSTSSTGLVTTVYDTNSTTVSDEAGKMRRTLDDRLGRLIRVDEPDSGGSLGSLSAPNQATTYGYDALNNLTEVSQGSQTRTFNYSSLARLTSATNPESGTVSYTYDDNGNLGTKTDAIGNVTTLAYDELNRVTAKSYTVISPTVSTSSVSYLYDSQSLPSGAPSSFNTGYSKGRLIAVTYGGASAGNYYGYDALGRVLRKVQQTDVNYLVEATYNIAGGMLTETYPSVPGASDRRTVTNTFDSAGRLASVTSGATSYALGASVSSITYAAQGGLTGETYGTSTALIHSIEYNSRLQPTRIKLGTSSTPASALDLNYDYGTTNNNGNILSTTNSMVTGKQFYTYDALNRLTDATETGTSGSPVYWDQSFTYDRYGNRTSTSSSSGLLLNPPVPTINAANNRFVTTGGTFGYDSAGNLSWEPTSSGSSIYRYYTYDAENHLTNAKQGTSSGSATDLGNYLYDGEGLRVKKTTQDNIRIVYGISGGIIAEFDSTGTTHPVTKEYVYRASGLLATIEPGISSDTTKVKYSTSDHLGSPRVITYGNGSIYTRHDYLPFGEEIATGVNGRTNTLGYGISDGIRIRFTAKERDAETELDFSQARYYASAQGRFNSVDGGAPRWTEPQTLNRYQYCISNPLRHLDPDGHYDRDVHYDLTRALALAVGFSACDADQIAYQTQQSDVDPNKSPDQPRDLTPVDVEAAGLNGPSKRALWHFVSPLRMTVLRNAFENAADDGKSLGESFGRLGEYLHASEDWYSHANFGPANGQATSYIWDRHGNVHPKDAHAVDFTSDDPDMADRMALDIYNKLLAAKKRLGIQGATPVAFDAIKKQITLFNKAKEGSKEKNDALAVILGIIGVNRQGNPFYGPRGCTP